MFGALWSFYCRFLPRLRGKQRLFKLAKVLPYRFARSYYGPLMAWNPDDSTNRACMVGSYGTFVSGTIARQAAPFVFLDIGANQGIFTLCAVRSPHCRHAFAFEPNPGTFDLLQRNIAANGAGDKVTAIAAAIAAPGVETVEMHVTPHHSGAASMFGEGETITARTATAAELKAIFERAAGAKVIAKIDVEGAEAVVLSALADAGLLTRIDAIIIEISEKTGAAGHSKEVQAFLSANGWGEQARSTAGVHYDAVYLPRGL